MVSLIVIFVMGIQSLKIAGVKIKSVVLSFLEELLFGLSLIETFCEILSIF